MKSLQMQGFKSFGDKTEMFFDKQILGVVGPNGCGKSNIVDAIRWVMGEQSAKGLRGNDMSDVIFNGTTERKKASFAEVSLTFDNADKSAPHPYSDCAEVMITRRLYRSGESEYLINKVAVRLKDITDLFLGTGSSARAYSIVAQGKVDQIVLAKPEDRRFLLEEAAGIAKYKVRRQAAERKMEATKTNLDRVHDIVQELERNARSLDRQVERAEKFRKLQSELRRLDEMIIAVKVATFDREAQLNESALNEESSTLETVSTALHQVEATVERLRLEALHLEKGSSSDYERLLQLKEIFSEADKRIEVARQRCILLENQIRERERDIERIQEKSKSKAEALEASKADRERLEIEKAEKEAVLHGLKATLEGLARQMEATEGQMTEIRRRAEEQRLQIQKIAQEREFLIKEESARGRQLESIRQNILKLDERQRDIEHDIQSVQEEGLVSDRSLSENHELRQAREAERSDLLQQESESALRLRENETTLTKIEAEKKSLLTLEEHAVGYDPSVLERQKLTGLPLLMDLLRFDPAYDRVGRSFLSYFGQIFVQGDVFENLKDGERIASLLETAQARPTEDSTGLNVWSCLQSDQRPEMVRPFLQSIEVIDEGVAFDGTRLQIRKDGALSIPLTVQHRLEARGILERRVTPHGRKEELAGLDREIEALEGDIRRDRDNGLRIRSRLQELKHLLIELERSAKDIEAARGERQLREARLQTELKSQVLRQQELNREAEQIQGQLLDLRNRIQGLVAQEGAEDPQALENLQTHLHRVKQTKEATDQEWLERRIELGAIQDRLSRLVEEAIQAEMTQSEYSHNQSLFRQDIEIWKREIENERATILEQERLSTESKTQMAELDIRVAETRQHLNRLRSDIEQREVERREQADVREKKQALVQDLELKRQSLKYEIEEIAQVVQERYHCGLQDFLNSVSETDLEKLQDLTVMGAYEVEAKELREQVEKFGDVNLLALSEFEEIQKRLEFMNKQKEDLMKTLDALQAIIDRINHITEFRFRETFKAINHNFQVLFPKLFGGGRAYMSLTNEDDLLETGVEIFAEPPGKKVQSMSLLSGGEKALTSISLLFALFAYRPASFCILDEVDAPLDEVNTTRYNAIIKEMAHLSQFIVITHNKRTMEVAETLFGVTMQEPGVSQLVGVELQEARAFAATAS